MRPASLSIWSKGMLCLPAACVASSNGLAFLEWQASKVNIPRGERGVGRAAAGGGGGEAGARVGWGKGGRAVRNQVR